MISRFLPESEWPRLNGTEAGRVWPLLDPENTLVLAVEDGKKLVGVWVGMRVVHMECLWIAPSHRGQFGVVKRLLRGMQEIARRWRVPNIITGSVDPRVSNLIQRLGGMPMPCESFIVPAVMPKVEKEAPCLP